MATYLRETILIGSRIIGALALSFFAFSTITAASDATAFTPPIELTLPTKNTPNLPPQFIVPVTVDDVTGDNINAYQFNVSYDPSLINPDGDSSNNFGCDTSGTLSGTAGMTVTCNVTTAGTLRISAFDTPPFLTGMGTLLKLKFLVSPTAIPGNMSPLTFEPGSVRVFDSMGPFAFTTTNGSVTILGPSSAAVRVGGRVMTADGRGLSNTVVNMTDAQGTRRTARTSSFGYYTFDDVASGATYVVGVSSKRYQFQPRTITVSEEITDFDLTAQPEN